MNQRTLIVSMLLTLNYHLLQSKNESISSIDGEFVFDIELSLKQRSVQLDTQARDSGSLKKIGQILLDLSNLKRPENRLLDTAELYLP
jgi:hypothetical protein